MDTTDRQRTIVIVDDSAVDRFLLSNIFKGLYNVLEAVNGQKALELLRMNGGADMVLTDIHMPELDGYGLLREMAKDDVLARVPVLVITSSDDENSQLMALRAGAVDILVKPYQPELVRHRVSNLLDVIYLREAISREENERLQQQVMYQRVL